jgi:lipoprotein NlpD
MITAIFRPFNASPHRLPSVSRTAATLGVAALIVLLAAGCATRRPAPVEERPAPPRGIAPPAPPSAARPATSTPSAVQVETPQVGTYTVKRGDTLYQIALDNGLDYRELAAWNNLQNVDRIFVGQVLRLGPPGQTVAAGAPAAEGGVTTAPLRSAPPVSGTPTTAGGATAAPGTATPGASPAAPMVAQGNLKTSPKAIKQPYSDQAVREITLAATAVPAPPTEAARPAVVTEAKPASPPPDDGDDDHLDWLWPAKGKIIAGFSESANLKGIDIAGKMGEPVVASAPGKVVYAGSGLRGYGKLIIIKHNKTYLSAYAHNREILVKEGDQVKKGQKIAEMGNSDADQVKLHFEIRRLGKPMDPARYLPPA